MFFFWDRGDGGGEREGRRERKRKRSWKEDKMYLLGRHNI